MKLQEGQWYKSEYLDSDFIRYLKFLRTEGENIIASQYIAIDKIIKSHTRSDLNVESSIVNPKVINSLVPLNSLEEIRKYLPKDFPDLKFEKEVFKPGEIVVCVDFETERKLLDKTRNKTAGAAYIPQFVFKIDEVTKYKKDLICWNRKELKGGIYVEFVRKATSNERFLYQKYGAATLFDLLAKATDEGLLSNRLNYEQQLNFVSNRQELPLDKPKECVLDKPKSKYMEAIKINRQPKKRRLKIII